MYGVPEKGFVIDGERIQCALLRLFYSAGHTSLFNALIMDYAGCIYVVHK